MLTSDAPRQRPAARAAALSARDLVVEIGAHGSWRPVVRGVSLDLGKDLGTACQIADTIAVMHVGRLVELGPVDQVLDAPRAEYTRALISAVPSVDRIGGRPGVSTVRAAR